MRPLAGKVQPGHGVGGHGAEQQRGQQVDIRTVESVGGVQKCRASSRAVDAARAGEHDLCVVSLLLFDIFFLMQSMMQFMRTTLTDKDKKFCILRKGLSHVTEFLNIGKIIEIPNIPGICEQLQPCQGRTSESYNRLLQTKEYTIRRKRREVLQNKSGKINA
jgi:hypothetical protein